MVWGSMQSEKQMRGNVGCRACGVGEARQRTSNTSVAPGGMRPRPAPRAPYPSSGGMTSVRFPPSCTDGHRSESQARPSPLMARRRCLTQTDCKAQRHGKRAWNACMVMCRSQAGINRMLRRQVRRWTRLHSRDAVSAQDALVPPSDHFARAHLIRR